MNLFNQLNQRCGQSYIKEVKSWEGKEHKLARHKCYLYFNLRCLSQNVVPKGVKLNIKQFSTFQERKIIWKTHRSILNSQVRQCNKIIDKLQFQISKIKTSFKNKCNNKDFIDISSIINKSKEKVYKITKNHQIKNSTTYKTIPNRGTLQYQTSSERSGSSTCPARPSMMENNLYYRRAPSLL